MKPFRFHLDNSKPRKKLVCPACGRLKCFTPYVDELGIIKFPPEVGICDHKNRCGYHFTPKEYFEAKPNFKCDSYARVKSTSKPKQAPTFTNPDVMRKTLSHYDKNPFFQFLAYKFGEEVAIKACQEYNIGTSLHWGGSTVFWQMDCQGRIHGGKVILYDAFTGHRVKDCQGNGRVSWAHYLMGMKDYVLEQCYFGEHLLSIYPDKRIMIVESEKTAVIANIKLPSYLWLACGGLTQLKPRRAIRDRDIVLIPDLGGEDKWKQCMKPFQKVCNSVKISAILRKYATEEDIQKGLDIADFLLRIDL